MPVFLMFLVVSLNAPTLLATKMSHFLALTMSQCYQFPKCPNFLFPKKSFFCCLPECPNYLIFTRVKERQEPAFCSPDFSSLTLTKWNPLPELWKEDKHFSVFGIKGPDCMPTSSHKSTAEDHPRQFVCPFWCLNDLISNTWYNSQKIC